MLHQTEEDEGTREEMNQLQRISHSTRRWLILVRTAWCVVALLVIGLVIVSILLAGTATHNVGPDAICAECHMIIHSIGEVQKLDTPLYNSNTYLYNTVLALIFVFSYLVVAGVLIWCKPDDRMALFAAFFLVLLGVTFAGSLPTLSDDWSTLVNHVIYLGGTCLFLFLCLFPLGRLVPRWSGGVAIIAVGYYGSYALFC